MTMLEAMMADARAVNRRYLIHYHGTTRVPDPSLRVGRAVRSVEMEQRIHSVATLRRVGTRPKDICAQLDITQAQEKHAAQIARMEGLL